MPDFNFQPYLDFVQRHHSESQGLYIPTDAVLPLKVQSVEKVDRSSGEQENDRPSSQKVEQLPVLEGLRKYALGEDREHVLLAGRPGSGKSMALRQLAVALAKEGPIPVLVQLKGNVPILKAIADELENGDLEFDEREIKRLLRQQKLILLLDGINETKDDLREMLQPFRERYRTTPMIFTTRDLAIGGDLGIGKRFEMKPLSPEQLREFVEKYLLGHGEQLLKQLGDRLKEISETPLLLKMLCDVFDPETGQIPQNKGELFREFDRKYDQFKGLIAVSPDFRRFKSEILQHLAFVMMTGDEDKPTELDLTIDRGKAERAIEDFLAGRVGNAGSTAKEWLEDLLEHHLLQIATDDRRVEFRHQLFQEYYAAEALIMMLENHHPDMIEKERFQHFYLNYLKWTEPIAIVLSLMEKKKDAVRVVEQALDVDLMLGARLAGEVRSDLQEESMKCLLKKSKACPAWLKANLYGCVRTKFSATELINLATSEDVKLRQRLAHIFHLFPDYLALPKLEILIQDPEASVRLIAVRSLGFIQTPDVIPLIMQVSEDPVSLVRQEAVFSLREVGSRGAIREIIQLLVLSEERFVNPESDEHNMITMANHILNNLPREIVVEETLDYLESSNLIFLNNLIRLVGNISNYNHEKTRMILEKLQEADNTSVLISAKGVLSELKSKDRFESNFSYDLESEDDGNNFSIEQQETQYWQQHLDSENPVLRGNAILYFMENFSLVNSAIDIIKILIKHIDNTDLSTLDLALINIINLEFIEKFKKEVPEGKERIELLIPVLVSKLNQIGIPEHIQVRIAIILGSLGNSNACPILVRILESTNDCTLRSSVISALGNLNCSAFISIFLSELNNINSDSMVRWSASTALSQVDETGSSLTQLSEILIRNSDDYVLTAIQDIQAKCEFYNYEIYQLRKADRTSLEGGGGDPFAKIEDTLKSIDRRTKQMAEQPSTISISGGTFNGPVNLASNQGNQPTTIIDTQNNYFGTDEALQQQLTDLQTFITELESQHPNLQTEDQANTVVQTKLDQLQTQNPDRWQTLRQQMQILKAQFFNPERHAQAFKATIVEVTKAKWEESLIVKAIVTYLDKFSETPDKGA